MLQITKLIFHEAVSKITHHYVLVFDRYRFDTKGLFPSLYNPLQTIDLFVGLWWVSSLARASMSSEL